jgi:hypothetical protein
MGGMEDSFNGLRAPFELAADGVQFPFYGDADTARVFHRGFDFGLAAQERESVVDRLHSHSPIFVDIGADAPR